MGNNKKVVKRLRGLGKERGKGQEAIGNWQGDD